MSHARTSHYRRSFFAFFLLTLLAALPMNAQIGGEGAISGTVVDPTGFVIPNATVSARNTGTNAVTSRTTSSAGYFLLSPIPPGEYEITVAASGFRSLTQQHVTVDALQTVGFNPRLAVGGSTETVTVSDAPPALETENATLGTTMEQKDYTNLPLNMSNAPRNPTSFVGLMPGVQGGVGRSGEFNGSGSGGYLDEVYVDGIPVTAPVQQGDNRAVAYTLAPEAVEQFQVQTSGSPVEFEGQGIQNYVVKSGTNTFHGNAFTYVRNTIFDTWGFATPFTSINSVTKLPVKPVEHNIEFGGSLGGYIVKNKLFFFGTYDKFHYTSTPNPSQLTVPTTLARTGDFTEYTYPIYDPTTTAACTAATKIACRYQFMGTKNGLPAANVIPAGRLSAISQALQAALPAPSVAGISSNIFTALKVGDAYWKTADRIDYTINGRQRVSAIYLLGHYNPIGPAYTSKLPIPYGTTEYVGQDTITADIEHIITITPNLVNQIKYAFSRLAAPDVNATLGTPYTAAAAGLTGLPAGEASNTFPAISFSGGVNNPTSWHAITGSVSQNEVVNTFVLLDNLQWLHNRHAFTFGGQIQWLQDNYKIPDNSSSYPMSYSFNTNSTANFNLTGKTVGTLNTAATGISYADFLLGAVDSATLQTTSLPETGARFKTYAPYIQDDFKATPRLTLNMGLRWDLWTPFHEVGNRASYFDPTAVNPLVGIPGALKFYGFGANSCNCASPVKIWWKNFAPRVGFAYAVNARTVVRGAYGIAYTRDGAEGGHNSGSRTGPSQQGFSGSTQLAGSSLGTPAFSWDGSTANVGTTVFGSGAFPGPVPVLPNTDPTQQTGNTSLLTASGVIVNGGSLGFGDLNIGRRVPYFQNINFGVQQALTRSTTIGANYVASLGHFVPGAARGYWTNKLDPKYLVLGALLSLPANTTNLALAKAIVPTVALPYASFAGSNATIAQALVPFPQYSSLSDVWGDVGYTNYQSLQLTLNQRTWNGVTFTLNYTYSKALGDVDDSRSGYAIPAGVIAGGFTATQNAYDYGWQSNAQKQNLTLYGVWELPFGKGRRFTGGPRFTRPLVDDWQLSSVYQYTSGGPVSVTASKCVLVGQGTCFPNLNPAFASPVRQNGSLGSNYVAGGVSPVYLNAAAYQDPANYQIGNAPARASNGLWAPSTYSLNASLRKSFPIHDRFKFTFQADCFNVPNKVNFGYLSTNIDSASFGQTNSGSGNRDFQFAGRIDF